VEISRPGREDTLAAIYARFSKGYGNSIEEQEAEGRADCGSLGWGIYDVYSDAARSASRFATRGRKDWGRLLADLGARQFSVLWLWEASRGDRDAPEWFQLLALCRVQDVRIHIRTHRRTYDMSVPRDWRTLADEGVDSAYESEKTAERIKRNVAANAAAGRPHGRTPYGYERIYDERTRQLIRQQPHPERKLIIVEIFTRVAKGEPILAIARDLTARGIPGPDGGAWSRVMLRNIASNPVYIGRRAWKGDIVPGIWEPLVDEGLFWRVQNVLNDPSRSHVRPTRARHLLSYIGTCDECGAPLAAVPRSGRPDLYACDAKGCVAIREDWLDAHVTAVVIAILSGEKVHRASAAAGDKAVLDARAEADELQARLDGMALLAAKGQIPPRALAIAEAELRPKIKAAGERAAAAAVPLELRDLAGHREEIPVLWEAMTLARKKQLLRILISAGILVVKVRKPQPGGVRGKFDPARVITEP
jgi:DNA invertase Pin-like site-specific DNA recombinase